MKTTQAKPKTEQRQGYAAQRAISDLQAFIDGTRPGDDSTSLRSIAFSLLSAYQRSRIESAAASILEETASLDPENYSDQEKAQEAIDRAADDLATYTADNLATLIGSENWQAREEVEGDEGPDFAAIAFHANRADLEAALSRMKEA